MRNKVAKKLKMDVALALYVGDDVTEKDIRKGRKTVFADGDFKKVYRARKKNYNRTEQVVKVTTKMMPPEVTALMRKTRLKKKKK